MRTDLTESLTAQLPWQRDLYTHFHQHPELSMREYETADRIESELRALGYETQRIGDTGVLGVLENGDGATVLARADIDALPVTEQTGLDYASTVDGVMHACAHDMHATALLGAAKLFTDHRASWSGTYVALFQPGEETAEGARAMVAAGLTERVPAPDVVLSQHVMATEAGMLGTRSGPILSQGDSMRITVYGQGAHGSMPHNSVDPVVLAAATVLRLQTIVSREVEPGAFAVLTVGALNAGSKSNIIADRAELLVNLRTYDPAVRAEVLSAIERIVRAECAASGSPRAPEFELYDQFPLTDNDAAVTEQVTAAFRDEFGEERVSQAARQTASEDFSYIPDAFGAPYTYWTVGSTPPETYRRAAEAGTLATSIPANHSPFFAPAIDPTLEVATRSHVVAALAYLSRA